MLPCLFLSPRYKAIFSCIVHATMATKHSWEATIVIDLYVLVNVNPIGTLIQNTLTTLQSLIKHLHCN